jgi:hypothetical protein
MRKACSIVQTTTMPAFVSILALGVVLSASACSDDASVAARDAGKLPSVEAGPAPSDAESTTDARIPGTDAGPDGREAEPPDLLTCTATGTLPGGRSYCQASAGGLALRITDKQKTSGPARLLLFLHSDQGGGYFDNGALIFHLAWADANNARIVSVLAPNGCSWWQTPTHDCGSTVVDPDSNAENAPRLDAALTELRTKIMLSADPIFVHSDSGGSIFVSYQFLPKLGDKYPGKYAVNCGGVASPLPLEYIPSAALLGATRIVYTYGDQDFQANDAHAAFTFFTGKGFITRETILPGVPHCAFNTSLAAENVFSAP